MSAWTHDPPAKAGWYWMRHPDVSAPVIGWFVPASDAMPASVTLSGVGNVIYLREGLREVKVLQWWPEPIQPPEVQE